MNLYESIAWKLHKQEKYKRLPGDAVVEIIELASQYKATQGITVQSILEQYFNHAVKHRAMKKFDLTNKQKQLLFGAVQFLDLYLDTGVKVSKNVRMLHDVLSRISARYHTEIISQLEYARKQLAKIVNNEDVLCNYLVLSSTMSLYFAKDADIDEKLKKKIIKLSNNIHDTEEKFDGDSDAFANAGNICANFYENIEKQNNKKG